jgi:Uncharacterised nucleotidyltransferase
MTITPGPRLEDQLLLCCARTCMDVASAERVRDLCRESVDWEYLIRTAEVHGMLPLLCWNLHNTCPDAVPSVTLDQFRSHFFNNAGRNAFLTGELLKLLHMLEAHGIPAIPFKGAVLAIKAYGNLSLRQFNDLDILVHKQDVLRVRDLLMAQGYRQQIQATGALEAACLESLCAYNFMRDDGRVVVDLHWGITATFGTRPLDLQQLWARLEPISLAGTIVHTLSHEDLLLILCVHGSKHHWERLNWLCDVAEVIRYCPDLAWGQVLEQAGTLGSKRMLFLGLLLASDLLRAALPQKVQQQIGLDPVARSLAVRVRERLFREDNGPSGIFERPFTIEDVSLSSVHFRLRMRERLRDKVRYCLHLAHLATAQTLKDRALCPLPISLSFLYYLARPIRLTITYGLNALAYVCFKTIYSSVLILGQLVRAFSRRCAHKQKWDY